MFLEIVHKAFILLLIISGIPLALAVISGLFISILQAATSIQEQTSTYLVRFLSLVLSLVFCGRWFAEILLEFIQLCLVSLSKNFI